MYAELGKMITGLLITTMQKLFCDIVILFDVPEHFDRT